MPIKDLLCRSVFKTGLINAFIKDGLVEELQKVAHRKLGGWKRESREDHSSEHGSVEWYQKVMLLHRFLLVAVGNQTALECHSLVDSRRSRKNYTNRCVVHSKDTSSCGRQEEKSYSAIAAHIIIA